MILVWEIGREGVGEGWVGVDVWVEVGVECLGLVSLVGIVVERLVLAICPSLVLCMLSLSDGILLLRQHPVIDAHTVQCPVPVPLWRFAPEQLKQSSISISDLIAADRRRLKTIDRQLDYLMDFIALGFLERCRGTSLQIYSCQ